ncbi:MAG TPA: PLD nuclease N-terminal domain-containing protein [Sporichthya sp.]|nr:PLD nuclease N-terminal domain-containing protein [Sporichthya sp.]
MPITLIVLTVVLVVWALVEVVQANPAHIRRLPKWAWAILVVFPLPPLGAIAWFFLGRPRGDAVAVQASSAGRGLPNLPRRTRYVARPAPDDDPDFLRRLNDEAEHRRMLRRLEDDLGGDKDRD